MATFDTSVCNTALKLLRQDIEIASSDTTSPVAKKCRSLYDIAYDAVASAHDWQTPMTGAVPTDATLKRLLVYSLARELAIPITGRQGDFEVAAAVYQRALAEAIKKDVKAKVAAANDPVLAQIFGGFSQDGDKLAYAYSVVAEKKTDVASASENEVKAALGLAASTTLSGLAKAAADCLTVAHLAEACGFDANFHKLKMDEYVQLLQEYRKNALNEALASNTDPVLAQLVGNFRSDDAGLLNAFNVYTKRVSDVKTASENEVRKTLGIATGTTLDALAQACADHLTLAKLAQACGLDANYQNLQIHEYQRKVLEWRKLKLDADRTDDPILSQLVANFRGDDTALVNAYSSYSARIDDTKQLCDAAAKEAFGVTTLSGVPELASNCLAVAKLGPAFGFDTSFTQAQLALYDKLLTDYKQKDLEQQSEDPTSAIYQSCMNEVRKTLGVPSSTTADALMDACAKALCFVRAGANHMYEAMVVQQKEQEYWAKIREWRKLKLDEALASETDPVLLMLMPNFNGVTDDALVNAYTIYTKRRASVETGAETEIANAHEWATAFTKTATTHVAYPAYLYLAALKLAPSLRCAPETVQLMAKQYDEALEQAKVRDLEDAAKAETDQDLLEAFARIRQYVVPDGRVPWGWAAVKRRYALVKDEARKYVLAYHGWSFCRREVTVVSGIEPAGGYRTALPADCDRLLECVGRSGVLAVRARENGAVFTDEPVFRVVYTTDAEDFADWPAQLRSAYVLRLAAVMAMAMPAADTGSKAVALDQQAATVLSALRMADARANRATTACAVRGNRYTRAQVGAPTLESIVFRRDR